MEAKTIHEVVNKLTGNINPAGATHIDRDRKENLETFIEVFRMMHKQIDDIAYEYKDSYEHSIKEMVALADKQLDDMGIPKN